VVTAAEIRTGVAGTPVPVRDGRLDLLFHAPPPEGLELRLTLRDVPVGDLRLQVTDGSDGLDGLPGSGPGRRTSVWRAATRASSSR